MACPFSVMGFHEQKNVSQNCDLCGGDPQCVKACVYGALEFEEVQPIEWMVRTDSAQEIAGSNPHPRPLSREAGEGGRR